MTDDRSSVPVGVKAHWRDADVMAALARDAGAGTLEAHLTPRDTHADRDRVLTAFQPLMRAFRLVVHQPEWTIDGDGAPVFTDPSSTDPRVRRRAVDALTAAARLAQEVEAVGLVVHPGSVDVPRESRPGSVHALRDAFQRVRDAVPGMPLWLENMPWFYGWRGPDSGVIGRCTLGRHPDEYAAVADVVDGFCLDFCHAFLGAPPPTGGWSRVDAFLDAWGDRIRHAHASGAVHHAGSAENPRAGEGVPFTVGDMDAAAYAARLARLPRDVPVVPEIDGGFRDEGQGFRDALAWLRDLPAPSR